MKDRAVRTFGAGTTKIGPLGSTARESVAAPTGVREHQPGHGAATAKCSQNKTARQTGGPSCLINAVYLPGLKLTPGAGITADLPPGGSAASKVVARWDHGPAASMRLT